MPNAKVLSEKQAVVEALSEKLKNSAAGVLVDYKGITVAEDTELRNELRKNNVEYAVVKNTLLRFAVKNVGMDELSDVLNGTTALAISHEDPVAPARVINDFAKKLKDKFEIKGGYMDGNVMSAAEVCEIAKLPDLKGMLSMFAGALTSTLSGMAVAMQAYVDKQEGEAA